MLLFQAFSLPEKALYKMVGFSGDEAADGAISCPADFLTWLRIPIMLEHRSAREHLQYLQQKSIYIDLFKCNS